MSSATAKGNAFELEAKKILEARGWSVFRQHRKPMFMNGKMITVGADIFGCDIVAKKTDEKPLWIQVSTQTNKSNKMRQLKKYPWDFRFETVQLWLRAHGARAFQVYEAPVFEFLGSWNLVQGGWRFNPNLEVPM